MAFIGLAGVLVMLVGVISILIPLRFLGIKSRKQGLAAAIIGVVVVVAAAENDKKAPQEEQHARQVSAPVAVGTQPAVQTAAVVPTVPVTPPALPKPSEAERAGAMMPDTQRRIIAAVEKAREAYKTGANDMQKGAARPSRAKAICAALGSMSANGWVGQVSTLSSNGDGKGVLSIKIARDLYVKTWNNALSDVSDNTLIDPESGVFTKASAFKKGQWVVFSGTFRKSPTDCIVESSMTLEGSLTEPEFIFRFSDVGLLAI